MRRFLGWALLISTSAAVDNIQNAEVVGSAKQNTEAEDFQESIEEEVKVLRGSAVAWPEFPRTSEDSGTAGDKVQDTIPGRGTTASDSLVLSLRPDHHSSTQDAVVEDKAVDTASVYDRVVGPRSVWNSGAPKVVSDSDAKISPKVTQSDSVSVVDEFVRWNQDDCHPCEVPTQPPTLAPIYPRREDDYEDHLPDVTERFKYWEGVQADVLKKTDAPGQASTDAPTGAVVSTSDENYADHLPRVAEEFKDWEGVTDGLPMLTSAPPATDLPTEPPAKGTEAPSAPVISASNDNDAGHLPQVAEEFKDWDGLKESLPTSTDAPGSPTQTRQEPENVDDRGKYENCIKVIGSFGEHYECPEDATSAPPVTSPPLQEDTAAPPSEPTNAPDTVRPVEGASSAPETTSPDTTAPDTASPDTTAPDTVAPAEQDSTAPDTASPGTVTTDTTSPEDTAAPDTTSQTDSTAPDTVPPAEEDSTAPEAASPDTVAPADTSSPADTSAPDSVAPTGRKSPSPETKPPDTVAPESAQPVDTKAPNTSVPEDTENGAATAIAQKNAAGAISSDNTGSSESTTSDADNTAGSAINAGQGTAASDAGASEKDSAGVSTSDGTTTSGGNATGPIDSESNAGTPSENKASVTAANTSKSTNTPTSTPSAALGAGPIAGIVIGCVAFVAAVVGSVLFRQKMLVRQREESLFADLSDTGVGFEGDYAAM